MTDLQPKQARCNVADARNHVKKKGPSEIRRHFDVMLAIKRTSVTWRAVETSAAPPQSPLVFVPEIQHHLRKH